MKYDIFDLHGVEHIDVYYKSGARDEFELTSEGIWMEEHYDNTGYGERDYDIGFNDFSGYGITDDELLEFLNHPYDVDGSPARSIVMRDF